MARDFDDPTHQHGPWWEWKPAKAALEYLWRIGELAVSHRNNFHKVYDLAERVLPQQSKAPLPSRSEHIEWACRTALERLSVVTAAEVAAFWRVISLNEARQWLRSKEIAGEVIPVIREGYGAERRSAFALHDWKERLARCSTAPTGIRLLSPFDPLIRDRKRCKEYFGFTYRFEAFVPAPQRQYGYYVLPILRGDRIIGRLDPKLDRDTGTLSLLGLWWEDGVKVTKSLKRALRHGLDSYTDFIGASRWQFGARVPRPLTLP